VTDARRSSGLRRVAAVTALSIGLAVGGFGIASAASSTTGTAPATTAPAPSGAPTTGPHGGALHGWGGQRSDETVLTGDALTAVTKAATAKVPGGTIVRVETDADGNAKYEAHMTKTDGSLVTVYVDASYHVASVQTR